MKVLPLFSMLSLFLVMRTCDTTNSSMNQGLEEEKSFTRHAMEYHRQHPDKRRGDLVLETWSTTDYVAHAVAGAGVPGNWARFSDQMEFLRPEIRKNTSGHAFCVVQQSGSVVVLSYLTQSPTDCTPQSIQSIDVSRIKSGDMDFSGRSDFWVYVLKP
jgi:hypothetical protein